MGCVVVMLHIHTSPLEPVIIIYMPIPEQVLKPQPQRNDLGHDTTHYKRDTSNFRPRFLDHSIGGGDTSIIVRTIVVTLALYGLYSLIS